MKDYVGIGLWENFAEFFTNLKRFEVKLVEEIQTQITC
jgi:hypothetical protein